MRDIVAQLRYDYPVTRRWGVAMYFQMLVPLVLALLAVVGVFVEIPFVSDYAFWVMTAAFVILISSVYKVAFK